MNAKTIRAIGSNREYDAIVVGARAAGAATAMLLGRAGQRVLLVDRSEYGADTLSTHAVLRGGVMQLQRWGLLDEIRSAGTPAIRRTNVHYGDEVVEIALREQYGVDALYAPRRTVLDPLLVDAAFDAGVEVRYGVRVAGLRTAPDGRVRGITGCLASGEVATADAAVVIGADGIDSFVARSVGAANMYRRSDAAAVIYGYFTGLATDRIELFFRPGATAGVIPTNGDVANVFVGLRPARFAVERRGGVETAFRNVLREVAPEVANAIDGVPAAARFRSFPGRPGHLRRAYGPGWALVGDAGYFKDPGTAHGITDALRDAELLARSLLATGEAAEYAATRDRLSWPLLEASTAQAALDWDIAGVKAIHRAVKEATDKENALLADLDAAVLAA